MCIVRCGLPVPKPSEPLTVQSWNLVLAFVVGDKNQGLETANIFRRKHHEHNLFGPECPSLLAC